MGGEGAMMAANQSLKSNRDSRRKDRRKFIGLASDSTEKTEYDLPNASNKDLVELKKRLVLDRKLRQTKIFLFVSIILCVLLVIFAYYFKKKKGTFQFI